MEKNDFKSVMRSLFRLRLFHIPGVTDKESIKTVKDLIPALLVTAVVGAVVGLLMALFMEKISSPQCIRPMEGVYSFGSEVQVAIREGEKPEVVYTTEKGTCHLRARIGFFPYTDEGFALSGEYLGMYLTKPYQRNGLCVLQSDTTVKYWAALRSRDRFYD